MSVEPREIGEAARSACPHPIALNSFLSKDRRDEPVIEVSGTAQERKLALDVVRDIARR